MPLPYRVALASLVGYLYFVYASIFSLPLSLRVKLWFPFRWQDLRYVQSAYAFKKGHLKKARKLLNSGAKQHRDDLVQLVLLGSIARQEGKSQEAYRLFLRAQTLYPEEKPLYRLLFLLANEAGEESQRWLEEAKHRFKADFDLICKIADTYDREKEWDKALGAYRHCALKGSTEKKRLHARHKIEQYEQGRVP